MIYYVNVIDKDLNVAKITNNGMVEKLIKGLEVEKIVDTNKGVRVGDNIIYVYYR